MTDVTERKCPVCTRLQREAEEARNAFDRSRETDARVFLRRHMRQAHGRELPPPF
jgi:hypothetical protein